MTEPPSHPVPGEPPALAAAPRGNKNALKHGFYTREAIEERRRLRALLRRLARGSRGWGEADDASGNPSRRLMLAFGNLVGSPQESRHFNCVPRESVPDLKEKSAVLEEAEHWSLITLRN